jgi:hypothetical protein
MSLIRREVPKKNAPLTREGLTARRFLDVTIL